jgi:hypothetical protein
LAPTLSVCKSFNGTEAAFRLITFVSVRSGFTLATAMSGAMLVSGLLSAGLIWLGPETRGSVFCLPDRGRAIFGLW